MSLAQFAARRSLAQTRYAQFVADGIKAPSPWQQLKGQQRRGQVLHYSNPKARSPFCVPYRLAYRCVMHVNVIRDLLPRVAPCAQAMGSFIIASHFPSPITRVGEAIKNSI